MMTMTANPPEQKTGLTFAQAGTISGLCEKSLRNRIRDGRLVAWRERKLVRICPESLNRMLEAEGVLKV